MTTRFRIQLASLVVASICVFAVATPASAVELLDGLFNLGRPSCGCDAHSKSGAHMATKGHASKSQACCVGTPVLDAMTDMTRSMKCRLRSIELPRLELPCLRLPNLNALPCIGCTSGCGCSHGKGAKGYSGSNYAPAPGVDAPPPVPVEAPPIPAVDFEA